MFSSYNRLIIYFASGVYMDVLVSPVMRHILLSYGHVLKWLLPICIVITMICIYFGCVCSIYGGVFFVVFPLLMYGFVPLARFSVPSVFCC